MFSEANQDLIKQGLSPVVDEQWLQSHPGQEMFLGDVLVHHHIEQGPFAAAIPSAFHQIFYTPLHPVTQMDASQ